MEEAQQRLKEERENFLNDEVASALIQTIPWSMHEHHPPPP